MTGATRIPRRRPVWMIPAIVAGGVSLLMLILLLVVYPKVGRHAIRDKLTNKLAAKLGRDVTVGAIDVSLGHATIHDIEIRGPVDVDLPLVHIDRMDVDFDTWRSFVGSVVLGDATIDGVVVSLRRDSSGRDNVQDMLDRMRAEKQGDGNKGSSLPASIKVTHARLLADDAMTGATLVVGDGEATWQVGEILAEARQITATTVGALHASAGKIAIRKVTAKPPIISVAGGELAASERLALSGIGGSIVPNPERAGFYTIDLAGGYGGVPGNLWTAKGGLDTIAQTASIDLVAAKFQLDRLAQILERTPVVNYKTTSVDTQLHVEVDRNGGKFAGSFHLSGLNVGHPMIADKDVRDLAMSAAVTGTFDRAAGKVELTRGDFVVRDVPISITGTVVRPKTPIAEAVVPQGPGHSTQAVPKRGPGGIEELHMRFVMPPIACQRVLDAIPTEMAPYMAGYKLDGVFDTDIRMDIDWKDLDATKLDGHVGINHCKVTSEPSDSPKRLKKEFEHYVEVEKDKWMSFVVGPANDNFVPLTDISPHLVNSIMSTEDSAFRYHHGFITSEFRTALVYNLKAEGFKYGASSITMQLVKNVLLYREKTLARKLQELFLTWHVENTLTKDRILEIYFNVIEYGPGLYGIGPAAEAYFGKVPKNLNPVEAAFFSSILPAPKERYKQYCKGELTKWSEQKIKNILDIMKKRDRLTQAEYDEAIATPLLFAKDGSETEEECMKRTTKIIKNSRSTNPMRK